jgi:hypothetical protein
MGRLFRVDVLAGSIPYSAVNQPLPFPAIHSGTPGTKLAVQITRVRPISMRQDPIAEPT